MMPKFCGSSSPYSLFGSRTGILWNLSRKINLCVPLKYMYKTITKLYTASQQWLRSWLFLFFIPAVSQKLNFTTFAPSSLFFHFLLRSASLSCCIFNILLLENRICLCGRTYLGQSADIISSSSFLDFFAHDPPPPPALPSCCSPDRQLQLHRGAGLGFFSPEELIEVGGGRGWWCNRDVHHNQSGTADSVACNDTHPHKPPQEIASGHFVAMATTRRGHLWL